MSKDPAFLLYSKDWLQGTAEMTHQEKGVFMDLLCHQHQSGSLPADPKRLARLAGMGESEFLEVWKTLSSKFSAVYNASALPNAGANAGANADPFALPNAGANADRVANKKLVSVMGERQENAHVNYIISVWSHILRESDLSKAEKDKIRKQFKVSNFKKYSREEVSERIREWWCERTCVRTPSLEDAVGNEDGNEDKRKGGVGEKQKSELPSVYLGWDLKIPDGFPEEKFARAWNIWRIYRKRRHRFVFDSVDTEQSALNRFAQEVAGKSWEWIEDCMNFCMEKGWMSLIPAAYEKAQARGAQEKVHNTFSKKATSV
jgi:hypothetical protein